MLAWLHSSPSPWASEWLDGYACLTYEELIRRGEVRPGNDLPPLLPVAAYNGWPR